MHVFYIYLVPLSGVFVISCFSHGLFTFPFFAYQFNLDVLFYTLVLYSCRGTSSTCSCSIFIFSFTCLSKFPVFWISSTLQFDLSFSCAISSYAICTRFLLYHNLVYSVIRCINSIVFHSVPSILGTACL